MPLVRGVDRGLDVGMLVQRRNLALQAMQHLGRNDANLRLTADTIQSISDLPAADLATHIKRAESLLASATEELPGQDAITLSIERANRRLVAYRELQTRLMSESRDAEPGELHIVQDLYSKPGFLLVWTAIDERRRAAVQVDASDLLRSLSETLPHTTGVYVVDGRGLPLGIDGRIEADAEPIPVSVSVGLGRLFPQLHIAATGLDSPENIALDRVLLPLAPLGVSLILGLLAVGAQLTADRRERDLQHRQQEFITRVTHELKTPLAGIRVMAETLQLGAAEDSRTRDQFLDRILAECNNLSARIDEVLSAARKPQIKNIVEVSANEMVASVVERWEPRFIQADAKLETRLDATPVVSVDLDLMSDAIGNLLDNALKYSRPGIPGRCRVRTGTTGRWVIIEVADNGMGVPRDKRKAVFDRFTRVEGTGRGKAGGHGLGLSFVSDAAEAHSGLVECVDGIDGGACFRIKLPRR
jgi:signal transduction histidine kinase